MRSQFVKLKTNEAPTGIRENNKNPIKFGAINASPVSKFLLSREIDEFFKSHYLTLAFSKAIAAGILSLQQRLELKYIYRSQLFGFAYHRLKLCLHAVKHRFDISIFLGPYVVKFRPNLRLYFAPI